jgi:phytoene synthase
MQLTNIARDVGEDARAGRLYLPHEWLVEAGIDPAAWLAAPRFSAALGEVVGRLLAVADRHYRGAEQGIADLPADCRGAIRAARLIYAEIGRVVERNGLDSVSQRAVTSSARKLALVAMAHVSAGRGKAGTGHSLPEVAFLVRAALDAAPARCTEEPAIAWWNLEARWGRALEMLVRLEAQQ